jgi:hypothetical protein
MPLVLALVVLLSLALAFFDYWIKISVDDVRNVNPIAALGGRELRLDDRAGAPVPRAELAGGSTRMVGDRSDRRAVRSKEVQRHPIDRSTHGGRSSLRFTS